MYRLVKRFFDIFTSFVLLFFISPILIILAVVIRLKLGSPIFFTQMRSTIGGRSFRLIKFRTMTNKCDKTGQLLPDEMRKTRFGTWLRNTSLDELPELINILKGDMSVIGPRSMPISYNDFFSEYEKKRFLVRGGLLPPEIIQNNPMPSWDEQLKWEAEYGLNCSLTLDFKIFIQTFRLLFHRAKADYGDYTRESLIKERLKN